jgi:hypothetical protein
MYPDEYPEAGDLSRAGGQVSLPALHWGDRGAGPSEWEEVMVEPRQIDSRRRFLRHTLRTVGAGALILVNLDGLARDAFARSGSKKIRKSKVQSVEEYLESSAFKKRMKESEKAGAEFVELLNRVRDAAKAREVKLAKADEIVKGGIVHARYLDNTFPDGKVLDPQSESRNLMKDGEPVIEEGKSVPNPWYSALGERAARKLNVKPSRQKMTPEEVLLRTARTTWHRHSILDPDNASIRYVAYEGKNHNFYLYGSVDSLLPRTPEDRKGAIVYPYEGQLDFPVEHGPESPECEQEVYASITYHWPKNDTYEVVSHRLEKTDKRGKAIDEAPCLLEHGREVKIDAGGRKTPLGYNMLAVRPLKKKRKWREMVPCLGLEPDSWYRDTLVVKENGTEKTYVTRFKTADAD